MAIEFILSLFLTQYQTNARAIYVRFNLSFFCLSSISNINGYLSIEFLFWFSEMNYSSLSTAGPVQIVTITDDHKFVLDEKKLKDILYHKRAQGKKVIVDWLHLD